VQIVKSDFNIIEFTNPSGNIAYRVTGMRTVDGKRVQVRENYKTAGEALGRKQALEIEATNQPKRESSIVITRLTDMQVSAAEAAFKILDGRSIIAAAQYFVDNYQAPVASKLFSVARAEFIAEKKAEGLRDDAMRNLKGRTGWLEKRLPSDRMVSDITTAELRAFLLRKDVSQRTRINDRLAWNNFFGWAAERKYCPSNPIADIKPFGADESEPQVLSLDEVRRLIDVARQFKGGICLPYVALSLFAAMRPDKELKRLEWSAIDLDEKLIRVSGKVAKLRGRRNVEMSDNLVEMLRPFKGKPIKHANILKDFRRVKEICGWDGQTEIECPVKQLDGSFVKMKLRPWPQDIMRHTAISMHLAKHQHEGKTASWAGNSPDIIQRHYKGLVKAKDAEAFWVLQ
jgi:integrase